MAARPWGGGRACPPVEEHTLLVSRSLPQTGVIQHPAVQRDVVAASDDLQRLSCKYSIARMACSTPWMLRQRRRAIALLAEDEATSDIDVDGQHNGLF